MFLNSFVACLAALSPLLLTFASPVELSNAERIQRGLPLKAPSRRYDPSRTNHLYARASIAPVAQQPGSAFLQVTRVAPGSKRQMSSVGYLSLNPSTGTFQVGSSGSAISLSPPRPNAQTDPLYIVSPEYFNRIICSRIVNPASNGQPGASFILDPPGSNPNSLFGDAPCAIWRFDKTSNGVYPQYNAVLPRQDYVLTVDPSTSNLIGWTGDASTLPPVADRVILTLVYSTVDQPVVSPGSSYQAVLRVTRSGQPYYYLQYRESSNFARFYTDIQSAATVFTVYTSPSNASQIGFKFTFAGTQRTLGIQANQAIQCAGPEANCDPGTFLIATPSLYDQYVTASTPQQVDCFTYPSYIRSVNGLAATFTVTGDVQGQTVTKRVDLGFYNPQNIDVFNANPGGYNDQVAIDIIPI